MSSEVEEVCGKRKDAMEIDVVEIDRGEGGAKKSKAIQGGGGEVQLFEVAEVAQQPREQQ